MPLPEIIKQTGVSKSRLYNYRKIAIERGYDLTKDLRILLKYVENAPKLGRSVKATEEVKSQIMKLISKNFTTRKLFTQAILEVIAKIGTVILAKTV